MPQNDFLPFAVGGGANVIDQATYAAATALLANGFSSGTALSNQLNKVWRQSSIMAAVLAQFIVDASNNDAIDDGTLTNLLLNLKTGIVKYSAPAGTVIHIASNTAPAGFLQANGAAISRTLYSDLFSVIGTLFGPGDGASTFNIPDLRLMIMKGLGGARTLGSYEADSLKIHNHSASSSSSSSSSSTSTVYDPGHVHYGAMGGHTGGSAFGGGGVDHATVNTGISATGITVGTSTSTSTSTSTTVGNSAGTAENLVKNIALLTCIKF